MDINYKDFKVLKRGESGWVYIYILKDPITNEVRYVGKTQNALIRLKEHIRKSHLTKTHKNNWVQKLIKNNLTPIMEIIALVPEDTQGIHEQNWIDKYKNEGVRLTNIADGGVGGNLGPIVNQKISEALKGKKLTEVHKKNISKGCIGLKASSETKEKMSKNNSGEGNPMYGIQHSFETKEKIGISSSKRNSGEGNPMYGIQHTEKTINKIKNTLSLLNSGENNPFFGKKHTEEYKNKKRKKVKQLTIDGILIKIWDSISEAATTLGIQQSGISGVCDKENKTYYNYKWVKLIK